MSEFQNNKIKMTLPEELFSKRRGFVDMILDDDTRLMESRTGTKNTQGTAGHVLLEG